MCPGRVCWKDICVFTIDLIFEVVLPFIVVASNFYYLSKLHSFVFTSLKQQFDLLVLIVVKGNLILGFIGTRVIVTVILKDFSTPPALDIINQLAAQHRFLLSWRKFLGIIWDAGCNEFTLNFYPLDITFNLDLINFKELNSLWFSNLFWYFL